MNTTKNGHTPGARLGCTLNWLVVNPEGLLLAILDSESEAYWFTRNRGHANGAIYFKAPFDYAAAPDLLAALQRLELHTAGFERTAKMTDQFRAGFVASLSAARAAIAKATPTKTS